MVDLETRLRETLQARAQDVEPTPLLWERVQQKRRRRTTLAWSIAGVATAVAAVVGVAILPNMVAGGPDDAPVVVGPAPVNPVNPRADVPPFVVIGDPGLVEVVATASGEVVHSFDVEPGAEIVDVAVRPSTRVPDLEVAWVQRIDGRHEIVVSRQTADAFARYRLEEELAADAPAPSLTWSPDGRHLAWVVNSPAPGAPEEPGAVVRLRIADREDTELAPVGYSWNIGGGVRLADWVRTGDGAGTITGVSDDGQLTRFAVAGAAVEVLLEQAYPNQVPPAAESLEADPLPLTYADVAHPEGDESVRIELLASGLNDQAVPRLRAIVGPEVIELALPVDLVDADPASLRLAALGQAYAVLSPDQSHLFTRGAGLVGDLPVAGSRVLDFALGDVPSEPGVGPAAPAGLVLSDTLLATDGAEVFLLGTDGSRGQAAYQAPADRRVVAIAARPGTPGEAVLVLDDDSFVHLRPGAFRFSDPPQGPGFVSSALPARYQPRHDGARAPQPVWSPDGDYLAWLEHDGSGAATFRVVGWGPDGPGTGVTATDNAAFALRDGTAGYELIDWRWDDIAATVATLIFRTNDPDGVMSWSSGTLRRQADGAISDVEELGGEPDHGTTTLDSAGRFTLLLRQGAPEGPLTLVDAAATFVDLGSLTELGDTSLRIDAFGDGVVLYGNGLAFFIRADGVQRELPGGITAAAFVPTAGAITQPSAGHPRLDRCDATEADYPAAPAGTRQVYAHFFCGEDLSTFPVARRTVAPAVLTFALQQLFAGPDDHEQEIGFDSPFSGDTADLLLRATLDEDGNAVIDLRGEVLASVTLGHTATGRFVISVAATAFQFSNVEQVELRVDGSADRACDALAEDSDAPCVPYTRAWYEDVVAGPG